MSVPPPNIFRLQRNIILIKLERRTGKDRRSGYERRENVRKRRKKTILVLDADKKQNRQLCELITSHQYKAASLYSRYDLAKTIAETECLAIFWDLDTVPVENRIIRDHVIKFPGVYVFGLSRQKFHPELEDAICYHIYACVNRPVDPDELLYWLRSVDEDESDPDTSTHS